jgi:hypothetical protein
MDKKNIQITITIIIKNRKKHPKNRYPKRNKHNKRLQKTAIPELQARKHQARSCTQNARASCGTSY